LSLDGRLAWVECPARVGEFLAIEREGRIEGEHSQLRRHKAKLSWPGLAGIGTEDVNAVQAQEDGTILDANIGISGGQLAAGVERERVIAGLNGVLAGAQFLRVDVEAGAAVDVFILVVALEEELAVDVGIADPEDAVLAEEGLGAARIGEAHRRDGPNLFQLADRPGRVEIADELDDDPAGLSHCHLRDEQAT
jgi:hypothetical protein